MLLGVADIKRSECNNRNRSKCGDSSIVLVAKSEKSTKTSPPCYEQPHYILAVMCFGGGFLCLVFASGCWGACSQGGSGSDQRKAGFFYLGFIPLAACFWLIRQAFCLAIFCVTPCAVSACVFAQPHSDSRPVARFPSSLSPSHPVRASGPRGIVAWSNCIPKTKAQPVRAGQLVVLLRVMITPLFPPSVRRPPRRQPSRAFR